MYCVAVVAYAYDQFNRTLCTRPFNGLTNVSRLHSIALHQISSVRPADDSVVKFVCAHRIISRSAEQHRLVSGALVLDYYKQSNRLSVRVKKTKFI